MNEASNMGNGIESGANERRTRCEVWTRVMGYHRPVSHFNIGKKAEHYSRKHFTETVVANRAFCQQYEFVAC
ncbi:MAG: anaerobic ribonucleoside-triphosphate reductase [Candidatus Moraniibacteriota bacterium]